MATEWDVFALPVGGDPYDVTLTYLATLYDAREKTIRVELDGPGSGSFAISKQSTEATAAVLAKGNLVKVRIPEIDAGYLFAFFLETGDFTLVSSDEEGGEMLRFGGRGSLSYLEYARAWSTSMFPAGADPVDGLWRAYLFGGGNEPGAILWRTIAEMTHTGHPYPALPLLTYDFDDDLDSDGNAWTDTDATAEFTYKVGDDGLSIAKSLVDTDVLTLQMGPDLDLHGYNSFGRDLTATIRFAHGLNIASELRRQWVGPAVPETVMLVAGETDHYAIVPASDAATHVLKHGFMTTFGTGATALTGQGTAELANRRKVSETITFQIANRRTVVDLANPVTVGAVVGPDATDGAFLPGPDGTNGDFWVGDTVTLFTGTGSFDFNDATMRVKAITIGRDDDNHELIVLPELEATTINPCPSPTPTGYYQPLGSDTPTSPARATPADGVHYYWHTGQTQFNGPGDPTVGYNDNAWSYGEFGYTYAPSPCGYIDSMPLGWGNIAYLYIVGDGSLEVLMPYRSVGNTTAEWGMTQYDADPAHPDQWDWAHPHELAAESWTTSKTVDVRALRPDVPDVACAHLIAVSGSDPAKGSIAYAGSNWTALE